MRNPSRAAHRVPVLLCALLGLATALYLGLFQLGIIGSVWDPIFHEGSVRVLHSPLSRSLPVPDSILGTFGYLCEAIVVSIGGENRYRTHPWIVLLYALIALAMGVVSLALVAYQAFGIGSWCTLCLFSALISVILILPGLQEGWPAFLEIKTKHKDKEGNGNVSAAA